jgi:hypothetical protein
MDARAEITLLLKAWNSGDSTAFERLAEHIYTELRLMARRYLRNEQSGNTLQPTAPVHEVYSKRRSPFVGSRISCVSSFFAGRFPGRSPLLSSRAGTPITGYSGNSVCPYSFQIPNLQ